MVVLVPCTQRASSFLNQATEYFCFFVRRYVEFLPFSLAFFTSHYLSEINRDSPDDSQTNANICAFPALLQD